MDRPRILVDRPVWTVSDTYQLGSEDRDDYLPPKSKVQVVKKSIQKGTQKCCSPQGILRIIISIFPCIGWIKTYKIKEYIVCDLVSGITSAIFHVPQGMANALANAVEPVYGLYGSFFPSAVYSVMGTSMQCSVGTFTVVSLIAAGAVHRVATVEASDGAPSVNATSTGDEVITPIEVTVAVTLLAGVVQVILGIMRLGKLGILISPALASGFMTGSAVQIIVSQMKAMFNMTFPDINGIFSVIKTFIAVCANLPKANLITSIMSLLVAIALILGKDYANPAFQRKLKVPLPVDLLMVIICTAISYFLNLGARGVPIVNYIPIGLPSPVVPRASILQEVIGDAISVGLVSFASTFSMGKTFARKYNHKVDANQEFLALGCGNILGGFFLCIPASSSLARSSVLESVGCKTQLTGMISCVFLLLVLFFVGPLLQPLPKCVLATILATALKGYLFNVVEVKKLWAISKADALIWVITCLSVIILDVTYGLLIGVIITLLSVTWRMQSYRGTLLREVHASGIYLRKDKKKKVAITPDTGNIIIFRFGNPLCFATSGNFEADINRIIKQIQQTRRAMGSTGSVPSAYRSVLENGDVQRIVIDLSSTCFVDNTGVEAMHEAITKCSAAEIEIFLAALPENVVTTLERSGTLALVGLNNVFPTIQDAVIGAHSMENTKETMNGDVHIIQVSNPREMEDNLVQHTVSVRDSNGQILQADIYSRGNGDIVQHSYL